MSKLYFKREDVFKVVQDAKKATLDQRRATFGQYLNGGAYGDKGLDPVEGDIERVNKSLKPELHLVGEREIPGGQIRGSTAGLGISVLERKPRKRLDPRESPALLGG